jgi:pimeloyl-ACP methyl ester carboxylesterase
MTPPQDRVVSVWDGRIQAHVKTAGAGPPVVFLHGAYGLAWDPFLDALAQGHAVYAPEHPGTTPGDPDAIQAIDDLWDLVLYYDDLLDRLGLEAPALVGHSFGAMVAAEIAATHRRRASRLVLISPIGLWRDDAPVQNWMMLAPDVLVKAVCHDPEGPIARQAFALPQDPEAQVEAVVRLTWTLGCTGKLVWPIPDKGLKKRLHRIGIPTLIVWGRQDGLVPPVYAGEFGRRISESRVEMVDRAAHLPHLEQLGVVAPMVRSFLGEPAGRA